MIVYLEGSPVSPEDITGFDGSSVTFQDADENGVAAPKFSAEITFLHGTYEFLKTKIITGQGQGLGELYIGSIRFELSKEDCCEGYQVFDGEVRGTSAVWCETKCEIKLTVFDKKTAFDCVQSTMIWDSEKSVATGYKNATPTLFTSQKHPRFQWCDDPGNNNLAFRFGLLFGFTELLVTFTAVMFVIQLIVNTIQVIAIILGLESPDDFDGTKLLDNYLSFVKSVERYASGCGNYHPAPLMRAYIQNVCDICGIQFVSSILNEPTSPYYDSVYLAECQTVGTNEGDSIEYLPGTKQGDTKYWVDDDRPLLTGDALLDKIKPLHNARWLVKNVKNPNPLLPDIPTLYYEREDYFDSSVIWIDFAGVSKSRIISQCYSFSSADVPAFADLRYSKDGVDTSGDKRLRPFYADIIEWNTPPPLNPIQVGALDVTVPFGAVSVRRDNVVRDPRGDTIASVGDIGAIFRKADKCLLITTGLTSNPKAMIWDVNSGVDEARVKEYFGGALSAAKGKDNVFNAPYMFEELLDGSGNPYPPAQYVGGKLQMTADKNLYHNFYQIRNPRLQLLKRRQYEIVFEYDCDMLLSLDVSKNIILDYDGMPKQGNITSIKVDFSSKKTMTVTGFI